MSTETARKAQQRTEEPAPRKWGTPIDQSVMGQIQVYWKDVRKLAYRAARRALGVPWGTKASEISPELLKKTADVADQIINWLSSDGARMWAFVRGQTGRRFFLMAANGLNIFVGMAKRHKMDDKRNDYSVAMRVALYRLMKEVAEGFLLKRNRKGTAHGQRFVQVSGYRDYTMDGSAPMFIIDSNVGNDSGMEPGPGTFRPQFKDRIDGNALGVKVDTMQAIGAVPTKITAADLGYR